MKGVHRVKLQHVDQVNAVVNTPLQRNGVVHVVKRPSVYRVDLICVLKLLRHVVIPHLLRGRDSAGADTLLLIVQVIAVHHHRHLNHVGPGCLWVYDKHAIQALVDVLVKWGYVAVVGVNTMGLGNKGVGVVLAGHYLAPRPLHPVHACRVDGMQMQRVGVAVLLAVYDVYLDNIPLRDPHGRSGYGAVEGPGVVKRQAMVCDGYRLVFLDN